jgi:Core-2/I-Branching enzyme
MRHAFLVTAYRDFPTLSSLIEQLLSVSDSRVYINIDGRSKKLIDQIRVYLSNLNSPRIDLQTQKVRWGSYEHFDVYMQMAKKAIADNCEYFHTITGQCRIIKPIPAFEKFFEENFTQNYIQHFELPDVNWNGLAEPRLDRVKYYQLHDVLDARKLGAIFVILNTAFKQIQKMIGIDRLRVRQYYGGIVYFSINRKAMDYLTEQWKIIKHEFRYAFCCEETVPQTILLNSPKELKETMVNFDLRYMLWETQHGENPGLLDERNFEALNQPQFLFARKFDSRYSTDLINRISKRKASS